MRLKNWDYSSDALYFLTLCTKDRISYFGSIQDGQVCYSKVGIIAFILWSELAFRIPGLILHEFVIMPNHIHGIIEYKGFQPRSKSSSGSNFVRATHVSPQQEDSTLTSLGNSSISNNLRPISIHLGSYKAAVSKYAHHLGFEMAWQRGFYDRMIREYEEYYAFRQYIRNNPRDWDTDEYCCIQDIE